MRIFILKNIKRIYLHPTYIQWIVAIFLLLISVSIIFALFTTTKVFFSLLLLPLVKPIAHFLTVPFLRLTGVLKYYSPMLLCVWKGKNVLEIHNGSSFDYLINMRWKRRGISAREKMIKYYLKGLLGIIQEIESKTLSDDLIITGTSYFFSNKSVHKIGFKSKRVKWYKQILAFLDFVNLLLMYSYSKGKITPPNLLNLREVEITGKKLVESKENIIRLLALIKKRKSLSVSIAL